MIYKRSFLGIPIARRCNRRWLVAAYWAIVAVVAALFSALLKAHPSSRYLIFCILSAILLFSNLPHLRIGIGGCFFEFSDKVDDGSWGIKTLFDSAARAEKRKYPPPDERERNQLNMAVQGSYLITGLIVLFAFVAHMSQWIPRATHLREPLFWLAPFLILNLPHSVLLWNEPDMETPNES